MKETQLLNKNGKNDDETPRQQERWKEMQNEPKQLERYTIARDTKPQKQKMPSKYKMTRDEKQL